VKLNLNVKSTEMCRYSDYKILVLNRKCHLGDPRRRYEDNITMELKVIKCDGVNWIHMAKK
jgi:hypothetical protein